MSRRALILCAAFVSCASEPPAAAPATLHPVVVVLPSVPRDLHEPDNDVLVTAFNNTRSAQARLVAEPAVTASTVIHLTELDDEVRLRLRPWRQRHPRPTAPQIDAAVEALARLKLFLASHGR